ncbi:MAG: hypothetical protein JRE28_04175 [Deltaproteobacteria bacterium]|nr:hypothetical protein [Deltaproteobacteria bacterium]
MNDSTLNKMLFLLVIVLFLFSLSACRTTGGAVAYEWGQTDSGHPHDVKKAKRKGPPPHAPAHGYRAKHRYRYYPACSVYYDDYRKLYFYLEGPNWRISASLPHAIQVRLGDHVNIEIESDKPYIYYEEHKHKYPSGKFKKQGKKKNKWNS